MASSYVIRSIISQRKRGGMQITVKDDAGKVVTRHVKYEGAFGFIVGNNPNAKVPDMHIAARANIARLEDACESLKAKLKDLTDGKLTVSMLKQQGFTLPADRLKTLWTLTASHQTDAIKIAKAEYAALCKEHPLVVWFAQPAKGAETQTEVSA